jgi:two-component system, NtrC family, sensor kinase
MIPQRRILIVDDNRAIHRDFAKILCPQHDRSLDALEYALFDEPEVARADTSFELVHAYQGLEAIELVRAQRFALAFVDMRMPPGIDGLETIERMWDLDPELQVVICSAYSDHSWSDLRARLGDRNGLLVLRKPFDPIEALQCAHAMTSKWQLAQQLRARIDEIEQTNERLLAVLAQRERVERELRRTDKLARIGQLAAGIAHEISTPIQYVGCNLELLDDLPAGEDAAQALASMRNGVQRITQIVRAMRELSHPGQSEPRPADINHALASTLEVCASAYKGVAALERDLGTLPAVTCHINELQQVFLNLIVNASHAMEGRRGHGRLTVRSRVDGDDVVVSIGDNGGGIPESIRARIFDPFFTTKDAGKGTGQGLAISRAIVERHAGSLTFDTELGTGTTFHVRIPIAGRAATIAA